MRIRLLRPLALVCLASVLLLSPRSSAAGGIGVSSAPCRTPADEPAGATPSIGSIPFHFYEVPPERGRRANRDYEFLWSDTYRGRFNRPLNALTGPEQLNDMDRLGQVASEFHNNALGLPWTNIEITYNFLAGRRQLKSAQGQWFDRDSLYDNDPQNPIGFRVAQAHYADQERNHLDVYVYAPSFEADGSWPSYHGDGGTDTSWSPNYGKFTSEFASFAEDSLTTGGGTIHHGNSIQIPGPQPSQVGRTDNDPTRWSRPRGPGNATLMHEGQHALDLNSNLHMFASAAEALTGVNTDAPRYDVDYHYSLSPTTGNIGNAYPHWQSFMAWLAFNWRGTDATVAGWTDDLVRRWVWGPSTEGKLLGLAKRLRDSECPECRDYDGFAGLDSLARLQRLIHDWRIASYVNNSTLPGGKYGFPPQFGFSPANDLGAWQNVDGVAWDDGYAVPPEVALGPGDVNRARRFHDRPAGPGFVARALRLSMFGAEYFVFRADPALATSQQRLLVRVRPDILLQRTRNMAAGCVPLPASEVAGRLHASVVSYSQAADSLFRHPEWASGVVTQSALLDSARTGLEFEIPNFGSTTRAAVLVVTLGDGPQGYFSGGERFWEVQDSLAIELTVNVLAEGASEAAPLPVAASTGLEYEPAWSPDGSRLAYSLTDGSGLSRIYLRAADGTGTASPLTSVTLGQHDPAWSPRGDAIAYADGADSGRRLRLVDIASGSSQLLTGLSGVARVPAFSPNGGRVAYLREWSETIFDRPPRDSTPVAPPVTTYGWDVRSVDLASAVDTLLVRFDGQAEVRDLRWSPNGRYLTFSRYDEPQRRHHLHQLDVQTRAMTTHDSQAPGALMREVHPGAGPLLIEEEGARYLLLCDAYAKVFCDCAPDSNATSTHWIALRDTLAGTSTPLAYFTGAEFFAPRWSPDGTKVAYVTTQNGNPDVYVAAATEDRVPVFSSSVQSAYSIPNCAPFELPLSATDPDGDPVTFEVFDLPAGAQLQAGNRVYWGAPVIGQHWLIARALDPAGAVATRLIRVDVYAEAYCGGEGGEDPDPIQPGGNSARQADSNRLIGGGPGPSRVVNTFLDGAESGAWVAQTARLVAARTDSAGQVRTRLVALRPGVLKLDRARLLVVDHAIGTVAVATEAGIAVGEKRRVARLTAAGGEAFSGTLDGRPEAARLFAAGTALTAEWAAADSVAGLVVDCARAGVADAASEWGVRIEVPDGAAWRLVGRIHPRSGYDALAAPLAAGTPVRLVFASDTYVREVAGYALGTGGPAAVTAVELSGTSAEGGVERLAAADSVAVELGQGQRVTLLFDGPLPVAERQRTLFLDLVASATRGSGAAPASRLAGEALPTRFALRANQPNPFGGGTTIRFDTPRKAAVRIEVFDAQGRRVRTLADRTFEPGTHAVVWDGAGDGGQRARPGVYLYRIVAGEFRDQRRMVLLGR